MLKHRIVTIIAAVGIGLGLGWVAPAQEQPTWMGKDGGREEYDLYEKANNAPAQERIAALDEWNRRFPDSNFDNLRQDAYLITYRQIGDCPNSFETASKIRQGNANHFLAIEAILSCAIALNPPTAAQLTVVENTAKHVIDNADQVFQAVNKPPTLDDAGFANARPIIESLAQRTYTWVFVQRKDDLRVEQEAPKVLSKEADQAPFSYYLAQALFNQRQDSPGKQPQAIFHFTRAGNYDGQNALPEGQRNQIRDYAKNLYVTYHGSDEGYDELLAAVRVGALPPSGFDIKSAATIQTEAAQREAAWVAANPDWALWEAVTAQLKQGGEAYFANMDGALLPGAAGTAPDVANPYKYFRATVLSIAPEERPNELKVLLGDPARAEDPTVPNVTIKLDARLPADVMIMPGQMIWFEGVPSAFTLPPAEGAAPPVLAEGEAPPMFIVTMDAEVGQVLLTQPPPPEAAQAGAEAAAN